MMEFKQIKTGNAAYVYRRVSHELNCEFEVFLRYFDGTPIKDEEFWRAMYTAALGHYVFYKILPDHGCHVHFHIAPWASFEDAEADLIEILQNAVLSNGG